MKRNTLLTLMAMACLASQGVVRAADVAPLKVIAPQSAGSAQAENSLDAVVEAVRQQTGIGTSFGAPSRLEVEMAETLTRDPNASHVDVLTARAVDEAGQVAVSTVSISLGSGALAMDDEFTTASNSPLAIGIEAIDALVVPGEADQLAAGDGGIAIVDAAA